MAKKKGEPKNTGLQSLSVLINGAANRSNKRAARREMPSPPPEPVTHDGARADESRDKFKQDPSGHRKKKTKLPSALSISKRQQNRIFKAESRNEALQHRITVKTEKYKSRAAQRRADNEIGTDNYAGTHGPIVGRKTIGGADFLKLSRKIKVGDMVAGSDSESDEWEDEPNGIDEEMRDTTKDPTDRNRAVQPQVQVQDIEVPF
ncbi:hypothetical protein V1517DRAFT_327027 [Lipomyces orientalis]|uniref:Uncharacterized protein n=1 Tax=Lipomyces orientalis TaxID=1233043 RepID=A0ACC3TJA3_9ASCO